MKDKITVSMFGQKRLSREGGIDFIIHCCFFCKYISTDYVFDGQGTEPWQPDCKDYKPLNVYGQTKLEGELAVSQTLEKYFIVRMTTYTTFLWMRIIYEKRRMKLLQ